MGRISHHASIVMWDLNNEGEDMMFWGISGDLSQMMKQYLSFYINTIIPIMQEMGVVI